MELSAVDPWGAPASASVGSAGPSPPPTLSAPSASGPWGTASTDPWGAASPASPPSSDPWGGSAAPPTIAPPPDPWGETSNRVNNVDPWGTSGKRYHTAQVLPVKPIRLLEMYKDVSKEKHVLLCGWQGEGCEELSAITPLHFTVPFRYPVTYSVMVPFSHILSSTLMLSVSWGKASMLIPFSLCV